MSAPTLSSASLCPICGNEANKKCQACHSVSYCSTVHQKEDWRRHRANCSAYTLKTNSELNRHVVASRKLKAGSIILEERPYVYGPRLPPPPDICENGGPYAQNQAQQQQWRMICLSCCKQMAESNACTKCRWPVCGPACAKAKQHAEFECRHFSRNRVKFQPSILPAHVLYRGILILRALLKREAKGNGNSDGIMALQSERADNSFSTSGLALDNKTITLLQAGFKAKDLGDLDQWGRVNGIIDINAFSVERVEEEHEEPSAATVLYLKSSLLAHSCVPNCTWSVAYSPDFSMRIRASKTIEKGELITVSYNQNWTYYGGPERRRMILDTAGFICKCERCLERTELGTFMSSVKCRVENCSGYAYPIPMETSGSVHQPPLMWKCDNPSCSNEQENMINPQAQTGNIDREWSQIMTTLNAVPMLGTQLVENFIHTYSGNVLHPNHWLIQQASRALVRMYGGQLKSLDLYQLENFVKHCHYLLPIANVLTPGISADRGLLLLCLSRALMLQYRKQIGSTKTDTDTTEMFKFLQTIHDYQMEAFLYWKDDVQSKPLDEPMGYEASSLHDEILYISAQMSTFH